MGCTSSRSDTEVGVVGRRSLCGSKKDGDRTADCKEGGLFEKEV